MVSMTKPSAVSLLAALLLGLAPAAPASAAVPAGWSIQASPNPPGAIYSQLSAVACPQASTCFAVGFSYAHSAGHTLPLAERWNGTAWVLQHIPTLPGAGRSFLTGISCAAASRCVAVGFAVTQTNVRALADAWNGTGWTLQAPPQPGPGGSEFDGVWCTAVSSCMAVGGFGRTQGANYQPLAERWNGAAWAFSPTPNPQPNADGDALYGVSCTAASACTAVGSGDIIFALRWNGTTWTTQHQPHPDTPQDADNSVSCPGASACTSVGYRNFDASDQAPLAEAWNGSTWATQRTPRPSGSRLLTLNGVSCTSPAQCIAVGNWSPQSSDTPVYALAEAWNGTAWALQSVPNPAGSTFTNLNGVTCGSADQCVAVGNYAAKTAAVTLVERYSG
jgi:hypothetical protein